MAAVCVSPGLLVSENFPSSKACGAAHIDFLKHEGCRSCLQATQYTEAGVHQAYPRPRILREEVSGALADACAFFHSLRLFFLLQSHHAPPDVIHASVQCR